MAGKYKWDAWKKNEGKSSEQAKKEYVEAFLAVRILGVFPLARKGRGRANVAHCLVRCRSWPRTPDPSLTPSRLTSRVSLRALQKAEWED